MVNHEKLGFLLIGVVGIACSAYFYSKLKHIAATVDMSVDELSNKTNIEVEKSMIDKAIQRAVDREVNETISHASQDAVRRISENISVQVKKAVDLSYSDVKNSVSDEISKQASNIDMDKLKEDVICKAKEMILKKFDDSLDDILSEFNGNLKHVSKIYESIANSITKQQEKETVFKIA